MANKVEVTKSELRRTTKQIGISLKESYENKYDVKLISYDREQVIPLTPPKTTIDRLEKYFKRITYTGGSDRIKLDTVWCKGWEIIQTKNTPLRVYLQYVSESYPQIDVRRIFSVPDENVPNLFRQLTFNSNMFYTDVEKLLIELGGKWYV